MDPDDAGPLDERARRELLDEIEAFFTDNPRSRAERPPSRHRIHLAAALLLVEMLRADQSERHDEHRAVGRALERALGLTADETAQLVRLAEDERRAGLPLQHFTRQIDTHCSRKEKRQLVEALWRVAYADAELLAHEEYLVRKIADLIHLPFEDFLLAKIDAREAFFDEA